jgi:transcriptional regulator with XRE-family HTH domain
VVSTTIWPFFGICSDEGQEMDSISTRIKRALKDKDWTQTTLGDKMGLTQQQISNQINKDVPDLDFVDEACKLLNIPRYMILLSDEEIAELQKIDPRLKDLIEDLKYADDSTIEMLRAIVKAKKLL